MAGEDILNSNFSQRSLELERRINELRRAVENRRLVQVQELREVRESVDSSEKISARQNEIARLKKQVSDSAEQHQQLSRKIQSLEQELSKKTGEFEQFQKQSGEELKRLQSGYERLLNADQTNVKNLEEKVDSLKLMTRSILSRGMENFSAEILKPLEKIRNASSVLLTGSLQPLDREQTELIVKETERLGRMAVLWLDFLTGLNDSLNESLPDRMEKETDGKS